MHVLSNISVGLSPCNKFPIWQAAYWVKGRGVWQTELLHLSNQTEHTCEFYGTVTRALCMKIMGKRMVSVNSNLPFSAYYRSALREIAQIHG